MDIDHKRLAKELKRQGLNVEESKGSWQVCMEVMKELWIFRLSIWIADKITKTPLKMVKRKKNAKEKNR